MSVDTLQARKAQADRELVSKFVDDTKAYERAVSLGFSLNCLTEPGSRRTAEVIQQHYEKHGGVVPNMVYLEAMAAPLTRVLVPGEVSTTLARVKAMAVQLGISKLESELSGIAANDVHAAVKLLGEKSEALANMAKATPLPLTMAQLLRKVDTLYEQRKMGTDSRAYPTPWRLVTEATGGIHRGYPHVIYGPKKSYKSTMSVYLAYRTAMLGHRVYLGTGELAREDIMTLLICMHAKVSLHRYRKGNLTPEEEFRYLSARDSFGKLPLEIGQKTYPGLVELGMVATAAANFAADVVVLDGAHRLSASLKYEDIAQYAMKVTEHAGRMDIPWVVSVQANRSRKSGKSENKRAVDSSNDDMGGSISWSQESAWVIRSSTDESAPREVVLEVTDARFARGDVNQVYVGCCTGENLETARSA